MHANGNANNLQKMQKVQLIQPSTVNYFKLTKCYKMSVNFFKKINWIFFLIKIILNTIQHTSPCSSDSHDWVLLPRLGLPTGLRENVLAL